MSLAFGDLRESTPALEVHPTVLVIDDDPTTRDSMAASLSVEGFDIVVAADSDEGVLLAAATRPSLILLDMTVAGPDHGLDSFHRINGVIPDVPIIMVTGGDDELDAVLALEAGAADHVTKPPRPRELTARIRAVLRRVGSPAPAPTGAVGPGGAVAYGPVRIDTSLREVVVRGRPVELSRKEFDLLALLILEAGHVVTRKQCMDRIWRDRKMGDSRTLDTHVKRLRKKIENDPADPQHIITVRGIGYRFKP
jgi:two-component system response regulator RegX3